MNSTGDVLHEFRPKSNENWISCSRRNAVHHSPSQVRLGIVALAQELYHLDHLLRRAQRRVGGYGHREPIVVDQCDARRRRTDVHLAE